MAVPTKTQTTAIVPWKERLAAAAAQAVAAEKNAAGTNNKIKTQGGIMVFNGARVKDNKLPAVIINAVWHNAFYGGSFDPDNPASPVCYAYSVDGVDMAPHPEAPQPQSDTCAACPHNVFGTAEKGKGKACKNMRRLGLIGAHELVNIDTAEPATIDVPPGSIKGWTGYVRAIADNYGVGPIGVITEVSLENLPTGGFSVNVALVSTEDYPDGVISDEDPCMPGLFHHADTFVLDTPYPVFEAPAKPVRQQRPPIVQRPVVAAPVAQRPVAPAVPAARPQVPVRPAVAPQRPVAPVQRPAVAQPAAPPTQPKAPIRIPAAPPTPRKF